jgi:hypothetical protein
MSSPAQNAANILNAQASTGPRTPEGKAASSKNSVVYGLFSGDFVRPGEVSAYLALESALNRHLAPVGDFEELLAEEILRAAWRLHRCGEVENRLVIRLKDGDKYMLDPMDCADPDTRKIQQSVDRARSQAHRLLHKCTAELRKLQAERRSTAEKEEEAKEEDESSTPSTEKPDAQQTQSTPIGTPRNAPCPCGSGQKHKRCCGARTPVASVALDPEGKDAPDVFHEPRQAA